MSGLGVYLVLAVLAAGLQERLDGLRRLEAAGASLDADEELLLRGYLELVTCAPSELPSGLAARFAAERSRSQRLRGDARTATIWGDLDRIELRGNERPGMVVWPDSAERWSDEEPLVPALPSRCRGAGGSGGGGEVADELRLTEEALAAIAGESGGSSGSGDSGTTLGDTVVLRYHAALLRYRGRLPLPDLPELPQAALTAAIGSEPAAAYELLRAEAALQAGRPAQALASYRAVLADRAATSLRAGVLVRALAAALAAEDGGAVAELLDHESQLEGADAAYFATVRLSGLVAAGQLDAALDFALRAGASWRGDDPNARLARDLIVSALASVPFTERVPAVCEAVFGPAAKARQVLKVGALALARGDVARAEAAFAWAHELPGLHAEAHTKLALLHAVRNDPIELAASLGALEARDRRLLDTLAAVIAALQARGGASAEVRDVVRTQLARCRKGAARAVELHELLAAIAELDAPTPPRTLVVSVPAARASIIAAPDRRFVLPEPYALVPRLER